MVDYGYLAPLLPNDFLVLNVGQDPKTGDALSVPFQIKRSAYFDFVYDLVKQGVLAASLGAATFVDNQLFSLSSTVTSINGVQDIFQVQQDFEILQVWYGIAPRWLRVWQKQPYGVFTGVMDQNIVPASSFPDVGFLDGYDSPYGHPSRGSVWYSIWNQSSNWALYNPHNIAVNPRLNFVVNRMFVRPVTDPTTVVQLLKGTRPATYDIIGTPAANPQFNGKPYGGINPIPQSVVNESPAELIKTLQGLGYKGDS